MSATMSIRALLAAAALVSVGATALAGPLTPPDGTPGPTMKTLDQVEPRRPINSDTVPGNGTAFYIINQPGSYYLTGLSIVTGDTVAILINAPDVTIDLNGFSIVRGGSDASTKPLIRVSAASYTNVVIKNGTLKSAGSHGIELASNSRVENVTVVNPAGHGIYAYGSRNTVVGCIVDNPTQDGINVGPDSQVIDSTVFSPGQHGITTSTNSEVRSSKVHSASQNGFNVAFGTLVQDCTATNCTAFGIAAQLNTGAQRIMNNTVTNCGSGGIRVYGSSQVVGNTVNGSGLAAPGISVLTDGSRIQNNVLFGWGDAVRVDGAGDDNLIINNQATNPGTGNGFANVNAANNQIGPVVTAGGSISSTSPFANFSH